MNITSILLKKVILEGDSDTWSKIRKHYLPQQYHQVYSAINRLFESSEGLPSFDALKLSIRNNELLDKVYAIEAAEDVDLPNTELLEFLKNEYTQEEIMNQLTKYLDDSIMMASAKDNVSRLQDIILAVEDKVDLKDPAEDMQRIELFASREELARSIPLGLNRDYDELNKFGSGDYILIGGRRGSGKSLTSANIAVNAYNQNRSSIYFTIEMSSRATLQRMCAIACGIPAISLRNKKLSIKQWIDVAKWWSNRFQDGEEVFQEYKKHNSFDRLHKDLSKRPLKETQLDIIYDPKLTLAGIKSELDKKVHRLNPSIIIVDYVNQVSRSNTYSGQYDWTEQIEISKALKSLAQEYEVPVLSPYQIDDAGKTRFSKGLLDAADAAFTLEPWTKDDRAITFECVKMRDSVETSFTSCIDWDTLRIGPDNAEIPSPKKDVKEKTKSKSSKESFDDLPWN